MTHAVALRAFIELRARLAARRFLSRKGIPELVARVVILAMTAAAALVFAGAVAAGTWRAARLGRGLQVEIAVPAIFFGIWQTWTAVALTLAERDALDLRRFLGYPLPPGRVYAYGLVASAAGDPFALFWTVLLGGAFAGALAGRPGGWVLLFGVVVALFIAATVAWVALLQELLGRLARLRRAREIAIALVYLALVAGIALIASGSRATLRDAMHGLSRVQWIAWPAALAAMASKPLFRGEVVAALAPIAALAATGGLAGWGAFRLALADALAGSGAGRAAPARPSGRGLPVGWAGARLAPLLEKEAWYLLRHPLSLVMVVVIPAIAALVAWRASPHIPAEAGEVVAALPLFGFALYAHVVTQPFWLNGFGWDRAGARLLFLAPLRLEDVLLAKDVAAFAISAAIFGGSALATFAVAGIPPAWVVAAGLALHAGLAPWLHAAGNVVAVVNPIGAGFTLERGSRLPMLSGLVGMALTSAAAGVFAIPVLVALRLEEGWLLPPAWLLLGGVGLAVHRATLPRVAALAERRREAILDAVCGEDE